MDFSFSSIQIMHLRNNKHFNVMLNEVKHLFMIYWILPQFVHQNDSYHKYRE
ncbi:MAG: hypothetical protein N2319_03610 [Candidatus Kapabacteria bacterium]|nr:hypothetical protein [Candidatus Kapabacteria bacterium]